MYSVQNLGGGVRLITMRKGQDMRLRFYKEDKRIKFQQDGQLLVAFVTGDVMVYKKPTAIQFGKELIKQTRYAQYNGQRGCNSERLLRNMLIPLGAL